MTENMKNITFGIGDDDWPELDPRIEDLALLVNKHRRPRAYVEGLEGNSVHEYTAEALVSEPGETTGAGTTDDPFTAVELPPVNHPDVDMAKDSGALSFIEYEDVVLERHPDLLKTIEKYFNDEENSMIERTTAAIENAGIMQYPHRIGISSAQVET